MHFQIMRKCNSGDIYFFVAFMLYKKVIHKGRFLLAQSDNHPLPMPSNIFIRICILLLAKKVCAKSNMTFIHLICEICQVMAFRLKKEKKK